MTDRSRSLDPREPWDTTMGWTDFDHADERVGFPEDAEDNDDPSLMAAVEAYKVQPDQQRALRAMPYADYLQTEHWLTTRKRALHRAGFQCKACEATKALNVHHLTYANLGRENETDLIVLCQPCHDLTHRLVNHGWKSQEQIDDILRDKPRALGQIRQQLEDIRAMA
jgi:hypothetical protein